MEYQTIFNQIETANTKELLFTALASLLEKKIKDTDEESKMQNQEEIGSVARLRAKILTEI